MSVGNNVQGPTSIDKTSPSVSSVQSSVCSATTSQGGVGHARLGSVSRQESHHNARESVRIESPGGQTTPAQGVSSSVQRVKRKQVIA